MFKQRLHLRHILFAKLFDLRFLLICQLQLFRKAVLQRPFGMKARMPKAARSVPPVCSIFPFSMAFAVKAPLRMMPCRQTHLRPRHIAMPASVPHAMAFRRAKCQRQHRQGYRHAAGKSGSRSNQHILSSFFHCQNPFLILLILVRNLPNRPLSPASCRLHKRFGFAPFPPPLHFLLPPAVRHICQSSRYASFSCSFCLALCSRDFSVPGLMPSLFAAAS